MSDSYSERVLAFAGILQACHCVQQIARTGMTDTDAMTTSINSIFVLDADDTRDIYDSGDHLHSGIQYGIETLSNKRNESTVEIMQYVISVIQLERSLSKHPDVLDQIATGIEKARNQAEHFSIMHSNIMASLADLYTNTLSNLKPRIMVNGEPTQLDNADNVNKIRTLLLAAIRSAVLWRQLGGSRLQLLFSRKRYLSEMKTLHSSKIH